MLKNIITIIMITVLFISTMGIASYMQTKQNCKYKEGTFGYYQYQQNVDNWNNLLNK